MLSRFFQEQMDYLFFCYGLAFILLAAVCAAIRQERPGPALPLGWLALFGLTHGIHEWVDMFAVSLKDEHFFLSLRQGLMTLSYLFLTEFTRKGLRRFYGKGPGRWIYLPLTLLPLGATAGGMEGLNSLVSHALGLISGLGSAWLFFLSARDDRSVHRILSLASIAMALYAFAAGLIVPPGNYFPASAINTDSFFFVTGLPIQAIWTVLAMSIAASLWEYHRQIRWLDNREISRKTEIYGLQFAAVLLLFLAVGWMLTDKAERDTLLEEKKNLTIQAKIAAAALSGAMPILPSGDNFSPNSPDALRLKRQLRDILLENPHLHRLSLISVKDNRLGVVLDSLLKTQPDKEMPEEFMQSLPKLLSVFSTGQTAAEGPQTTGSISGFVPLFRDPGTKNTLLALMVELKKDDYLRKVSRSRLAAILLSLLMSLVFIGFFVLRQRLWESAQTIAAKEKRLADAQRIARLCSWEIDARSGQISWSEEMHKIFDIAPEDCPMRYSDLKKFLFPDDWEKLGSAIEQTMQQGKGYEIDLRAIMPDGSMRYVVSKGEGRHSINGEVVSLTGTLQDITARKWEEKALQDAHDDLQKRTEELKALYFEVQAANEKLEMQKEETETAKREAEEANRAKSEFLANMSHELRTPLNAIIGFSDVLLMGMVGETNEEQRELLCTIRESGGHLLSLINDILDLSKVEAGKLELKLTTTPLSEIIEGAAAMLREKASRHGVLLSSASLSEDLPVTADAVKMKQIIYNLLSNAVKFTPEGGMVSVTARIVQLPDKKPLQANGIPDRCGSSAKELEISVTDTGIGIKPEDMPRLFKKFSQIETPENRNREGTGLGLSLSKNLVELHGGRIWAESEYGRGSRFTFTIPLHQEYALTTYTKEKAVTVR